MANCAKFVYMTEFPIIGGVLPDNTLNECGKIAALSNKMEDVATRLNNQDFFAVSYVFHDFFKGGKKFTSFQFYVVPTDTLATEDYKSERERITRELLKAGKELEMEVITYAA